MDGTTQARVSPSVTSLVARDDPTQRRRSACDLAATAGYSQRKAIRIGGAAWRARAWAERGRVFKRARVSGSPAAEPSEVVLRQSQLTCGAQGVHVVRKVRSDPLLDLQADEQGV